MNNDSILTLCVPTYNRAALLEDTLEFLGKLTASFKGVYIAVSDNCSIDNSQEIVEQIQKKYNNIIYSRQSENIGLDRNFEAVMKLTTSKYQWLLGESWLIHELQFENVLKLLAQNEPDLLLVNRATPVNVPSRNYTSATLLLEELGWHMTNLSSLIFSREMVQKGNFERYFNSYLVQFGVIFEYLANKESINVIWKNEPIIFYSPFRLRHNVTNSWYPTLAWDIFVRNWTDMVLSLPASYGLNSKKICILNHNKFTKIFSVRNTLLLRKKNIYNYNEYKKYNEYIYYAIGPHKFLYFLLSIWPSVLNPYSFKSIILPIIKIAKIFR